jgi:hypothetical protein
MRIKRDRTALDNFNISSYGTAFLYLQKERKAELRLQTDLSDVDSAYYMLCD